ncbi:MAG: hypothetical protein EOO07_33675 [Chitinophagaceae bacterium]|nr:MAG: hypothetical protein EOO07_33675 [Chitinophagaceae bacterium]
MLFFIALLFTEPVFSAWLFKSLFLAVGFFAFVFFCPAGCAALCAVFFACAFLGVSANADVEKAKLKLIKAANMILSLFIVMVSIGFVMKLLIMKPLIMRLLIMKVTVREILIETFSKELLAFNVSTTSLELYGESKAREPTYRF